MIHALSLRARRAPAAAGGLLFLAGLLTALLLRPAAPVIVLATAEPPFAYEVVTDDVAVDWAGGGDFDPRGKCPDDFFGAGFVLLCKKLADGKYVRFLYHRGQQLLYRIDRDLIRGRARIGLHWVESTRYSARYRIADPAYRGGKTVAVPTAKGGTEARRFRYGQAVSKKRVQPGRELFDETHLAPEQCAAWWELLRFMP